MVKRETIEKALWAYFHFNFVQDSDSVDVTILDYSDKFFRWRKDSFKHNKKLTVIVDNSKLLIFNTVAIRERLLEMQRKVTANADSSIFGCHLEIVRDLALGGIKIDFFEEISDEVIGNLKQQEESAAKILIEKDATKLK